MARIEGFLSNLCDSRNTVHRTGAPIPIHPGGSSIEPATTPSHQRDDPRGHALLLAGLFVNYVFNGGLWVLAEQLKVRIGPQ
jgi:hypothetical protein